VVKRPRSTRHSKQSANHEAGLLTHLADQRVAHALPDLDGTAREAPLTAVRALLQEDRVSTLEDDRGSADAHGERARAAVGAGDHVSSLSRGTPSHKHREAGELRLRSDGG
jgi:hypothetical protein